MIDKREALDVLVETGGSFTDISENAADFLRDTESLELSPAHSLYVGYYKPINAIYVDVETPSNTPASFTVEVWNQGNWVPVDSRDETKGMSRSGFITWDKSRSELSTVDGRERSWARISSSGGTGPVVVRGINILFCDKNAVMEEFYNIDDVVDAPGLLAKMVSARNEIMDRLAQRGYLKYDATLTPQDIVTFDLHDVYQVRQAAKFFTLAKIFFVASDNMEDHWWAKYEAYQSKAVASLALYKLDVDVNNNGKNDEDLGTKRAKNVRWSR